MTVTPVVTPVVKPVVTPVSVAAPVTVEPVKVTNVPSPGRNMGPYGPHSKSLYCSSQGFSLSCETII